MSNIYIQEPPTSGKVLLSTSVGDIDVELWSKEAPKACRNFVQLCMEGYYNNSIFHRLVPEFIVQGGDPTGTGHGGDSIWGQPFRDEFHSRLRFVRRGLVAMANSKQHDNGSQFFFTLAACPELNNKHTIFGKIGGDTIYNMLKLTEVEVDENDRPLYPHKIIKTKILHNPYDDIVPRSLPKKEKSDENKRKKSQSKATKNFSLLSFGEEAEEDEEETTQMLKGMKHKGKSSHDLLDDQKLSSVPAVEMKHGDKRRVEDLDLDKLEVDETENTEELGAVKERIRKKLKKDHTEEHVAPIEDVETREKTRMDEIKEEANRLKKDIIAIKKQKNANEEGEKPVEEKHEDPAVSSYQADMEKYKKQKKTSLKKGSKREDQTLAILAQFQSKLNTVSQMSSYSETAADEDNDTKDESDDETASDFSWMCHKLEFEDKNRKVIDANIADEDRYEIFDPRNPLTKRRREASEQIMKNKR